MGALQRHAAFGLAVESALELPWPGRRGAGAPDLTLLTVAPADAKRAFSGANGSRWDAVIDGEAYSVEGGTEGDLLFRWDGALFHLSRDSATLLCAPGDAADPAWRRVLLDSVLATVSMRQGYEALHAGAVERPAGVLAVTAGSGGGKSTLLAELVRRGSPLFSDDVLALSRGDGGILAFPGPPLMNLTSASNPRELGDVVAALGDEAWTRIPLAANEPRSLAALVVLERGADTEGATMEKLPSSHLALSAAAMSSGPGPERMAARFDLLGDLAAATPAFVLRASDTVSPSALAARAEEACG